MLRGVCPEAVYRSPYAPVPAAYIRYAPVPAAYMTVSTTWRRRANDPLLMNITEASCMAMHDYLHCSLSLSSRFTGDDLVFRGAADDSPGTAMDALIPWWPLTTYPSWQPWRSGRATTADTRRRTHRRAERKDKAWRPRPTAGRPANHVLRRSRPACIQRWHTRPRAATSP